MQFIMLDNMKAMLRYSTGAIGTGLWNNYTDVGGDSRQIYSYSSNVGGLPFFNTSVSVSSSNSSQIFYYASSATTIPTSTYSVPSPVGTTGTVTYARTANGWAATFTITGSEDATIGSIFAAKRIPYSSGGNQAEALIFALKLDTPVELNASNNYTANFTFAIEF